VAAVVVDAEEEEVLEGRDFALSPGVLDCFIAFKHPKTHARVGLYALRIPLLNRNVLDYVIIFIFSLPYLHAVSDTCSSFECKIIQVLRLAAT
jgi:hypothetical protein